MGGCVPGVLVVDDNATNREIVEAYLTAPGVRCETAASGTEALTALHDAARRGEPFELVVLDGQMPGMDGISLLKALATVAPDAEVVVMTAYGTVETAVQAMREGAYDFVEKPLNPPGTPDDPEATFVSMGNYIFTTKVLIDAIRADADDDHSDHDIGGDIIPRLVEAAGSDDPDQRYWAAVALGSTGEGILFEADERRELADQLVLAFRSHKGPEAEKRLKAWTELAGARPKTEAEWRAALEGKGDAVAGERVFLHSLGARCFVCHRIEGRGGRAEGWRYHYQGQRQRCRRDRQQGNRALQPIARIVSRRLAARTEQPGSDRAVA